MMNMDYPDTITPTILIGLGGIGSEVVDKVYSLIPPERRRFVVAHAFDTNVNDIALRMRQHLRGHVTQTSRPQTVQQYLDNAQRSRRSVDDWFPSDVRELLRKSLTDGAGMVRVVSRLAYRASMEEGRLAGLEREVAHLFQEIGGPLDTGVRVMIVSTLAGGTGAGIFLQVALYMRDLLNYVYGQPTVLVRGAFLLPDTLIKTGVLPTGQHDHVRANGYACLKELDAMLRGDLKVNIELEYDPHPHRGDRAVIGPQHLPYEFAFLFDFENMRGRNLVHIDNYIRQVVRSVHTSLFMPLSGQVFSQEDNQILGIIHGASRNRYCGVGVATIEYPYQDILSYCALRWATDGLTENWLKIDEMFREEQRQYERNLLAGVQQQPPRIQDRYVRLLDSFKEDDQRFFRAVHASAHMLDDLGKPAKPKSIAFFEAVEQDIQRHADNVTGIQRLARRCEIDKVRMEDREHALSELRRIERSLAELRSKVDESVRSEQLALTHRILLTDYDLPNEIGVHEHRMATWLLARDEPLHPVAVRYVLYQLDAMLTEVLEERDPRNRQSNMSLTDANRKRAEAITRYDTIHDDPATPEVEDASRRMSAALESGFMPRLTGGGFKAFAKTYTHHAERQLRTLLEHHRERLREEVLRDVRDAVRVMLRRWERYFDDLRDVRNHLLEEVLRKKEEHSGSADPTQRFVLATGEFKELLWERARLHVTAAGMPVTGLPAEIAREIYQGQYRRFCEERLHAISALAHNEAAATHQTEVAFRNDVVGWCREQLAEMAGLDLDVVQALRNEAERHGTSIEAYLEEETRRLHQLAQPWMSVVTAVPEEVDYWGAHPAALAQLTEKQRQELFPATLVSDEAFSRHEIVHYRAVYGLTALDLPKFGSARGVRPAGSYFLSYQDRRRRLESDVERTVTPHLDKHWHLGSYMPDLNEDINEQEEARLMRSFFRGLALGLMRIVSRDSQPTWELFTGSYPTLPLLDRDERPVPGRVSRLHEALIINPSMVHRVLRLADERLQADMTEFGDNASEHKYFQGCREVPGLLPDAAPRNLLDLILSIAVEQRGNPANERLSERLLENLIGDFHSYAREVFGAARPKHAHDYVSQLVNELRDGSDVFTKSEKGSGLRTAWENTIEGRLSSLKNPKIAGA